MLDPRTVQLEVLGEAECVKLLRSHDLGRLALVDQEVRPLIFPVNYFFDEGVIVFRTSPGTKLDLAPGAYVSFEIDGWDPHEGIGWSVLVKGIAHDITNPRGAPTGRMRFWPVRPLAPGSREHWVGIWTNEISGRRFRSDAQRLLPSENIPMKPSEPEAKLEEIPEAECLEILGQHSLGRIAIVVDGQPQIFPVNYAMSGRIIAFHTAAGSKLSNAPNSKVSFEIDQYDSLVGVGWSVMVQGVAVDATEAFDDVSWAARAAAPWALAPGAKPHRVAIEPRKITGRRFRLKA